jgi:hypothetical protein
MDLFAKLDPNVEREKLFASEAADAIVGRLVEPVKGELKEAAFDLSRELVALAKQRFETDNESQERTLVLEAAIILVVHLNRSYPEPRDVALQLGKRLSVLARKRFFQVKQDKKKDT